MVTFGLPASAYQFIVGQLEASLQRRRWPEQGGLTDVPALSADAERALRGAYRADGRYVVTCERAVAASLAEWFERMRDVVRRATVDHAVPARVLAICTEAAAIIRAAADSRVSGNG